MIRRLLPLAFLLLAAGFAALPDRASGCAIAPRAGESVDVAEETAFIIWDDTTKTEHLIRQATFVGSAYDFGFLVPTPRRPQVKEASADVFVELAKTTEPQTEHQTKTGFNFGCAAHPAAEVGKGNVQGLPGGVVVLEEGRVGNLDYASLEFRGDLTQPEDRAFEVIRWLNSKKYAISPDLVDWLKEYIDKNWIITAFRIAAPEQIAGKEGKSGVAVKASAVRMSFQTERPFFPYREPAEQRDEQSKQTPRLFRLFVAAKQRMAGKIGDDTVWPGQVVWTNAITDSERRSLLDKADLPPGTLSDRWWLTEFEDRSTPRPGTDELYLERSSDRGVVARPTIVIVNHRTAWWVGPVGLIALVALGGVAAYLIRRAVSSKNEVENPVAPKAPPPPLPGAAGQKIEDKPPKTDPRRWS